MVSSIQPKVIEGIWRFISIDVPNTEEEAKYGAVDDYDASSDKEDKSGSEEEGVITYVDSEGEIDGGGTSGCEVNLSFVLYFETPLLSHTVI